MGMSKSEAGLKGYLKTKDALTAQREKKTKEAREKYEQNKKSCKECNAPISYEDRVKDFCNSSCSAKYNNSRREITYRKNQISKIFNCLNCGKELKKWKTSIKKYCNSKCQQSLKKEERYQKLSSGDDSGIGHVAAKNAVIAKHGVKCMDCGWDKINPHSNKCPIELEHIDGNSQNNKLENLKLLCPNCHSLTATYKALNKGNGRHKRRVRYQEGKSY